MVYKFYFTLFFVTSYINLAFADQNQDDWIAKIEAYMNASKNWEASFEQLNPNGSLNEGKFFLQRPGKMRLVYSYPKTQTLLADGQWLIIYDEEHEELTTLALKETPAEFFLSDPIKFSEDVIMSDFSVEVERIRITIRRKNEPEAGSLTLTFIKNPLRLIQWVTIDGNDLKTIVNLKNIQMGRKVDPRLFIFNHPELLN